MNTLLPNRQQNVDCSYKWQSSNLQSHQFFSVFRQLIDDEIQVFIEAEVETINRRQLDGLWLIKGSINRQQFCIVWNDFRVNGGSFGKRTAQRFNQFIDYAIHNHLPVLIAINSMGYRFIEGRAIFNDVFGMLSTLKSFAEHNLLITYAHGQCLGIGALLFAMGHYRIAQQENTIINLTGPEVLTLFFGKNFDYSRLVASPILFKKTALIHQLVQNHQQLFEIVKNLIKVKAKTRLFSTDFSIIESKPFHLTSVNYLLYHCCDYAVQIFNNYDDKLLIFIASLSGKHYGLILNPPGHINNMLTARTLELFCLAFGLFKQLELPILSLVDTPGADPREENGGDQIIEKLLSVSKQIIDYPYKKMGIGIGRIYGGASILNLPKVFSDSVNYILSDAQTGVMDPKIIDYLLIGSQPLKTKWQTIKKKEANSFNDLLAANVFDDVIDLSQVKGLIKTNLL